MSSTELTKEVLQEVLLERGRQDAKWGCQRHLPMGQWLAILGEEYGEVSTECIRGERPNELLQELVQVAAVCVAWIESISTKGAITK